MVLDRAPDSDEQARRDAEADANTIARVLAGDREAFGVLVARYTRRLYDLARRMLRDADEAEDAVQQAFLNAFRALDRFDPRRPFRHWLLRIASNLCRNRLVARGHRPEPAAVGAAAGDEGAVAEPAARPDAGPPSRDSDLASGSVRAAIDALPDTYRLPAILRYVHGLDLSEIAEITDEPIATVKTHLHRARAALRAALEGAGSASGETPRGLAGTGP